MVRKNVTTGIQEYLDEIFGSGAYTAEHRAFKGFDAVSINDGSRPPHSIYLGANEAQAHSKLDEIAQEKRRQGNFGQPG